VQERGQNDWQLIDHEDTGLTMTRKQDVDEMFLWRPEVEDG